MKNNKEYKFLEYLNTPISKENIAFIYEANNVNFDRCNLYCDFILSLLILTFDTYLGDDITSNEQRVKHFQWCWDKNIKNFKEEGFTLENDKIYEYFLEYMREVFYLSDKANTSENLKLWSDLFDYSRNRTQSDMDTFIEVYKLFDKPRVKNS